MANLNKVILIGRLTKDPEAKELPYGKGKVAKFGFAVTNRKKGAGGEWEDDPMFIDCEAWNRGDHGKLAEQIVERCRKGSQLCIEARLQLDQWVAIDGAKRSKHKLVVDSVQFLDRREDAGEAQAKPQRHGTDPGDIGEDGGEIPF